MATQPQDGFVPIATFNNFVRTVSSISQQRDASEVALIIIDEACKVLDCERTSFFFVDGDNLDLVIGKGLDSIRLPKNSGIAGACATQGETINVPEPYKDDRFNQSFDKKNNFVTRSILAAPVVDPEGEIVGVLQGINKHGGPFTKTDEQLIHCLACQVGVSIRYTYQLEEAERATRQRNALVSCIRDVSSNSNVQHLLFTMNKAAEQLVEADRCTFYTVNKATETLHLIKSDSPSDISFPMSAGLAGHVATTGESLNIPDAYEDKRFNPAFDKKTGYRTKSMLVIPVFSDYNDFTEDHKDRSPIGVLQLINKTNDEPFTHEDEDVLQILMRFIGPAISTSPLFQGRASDAIKTGSEARKFHDLPQHLVRKPSRELVIGTPRAIPTVIKEGDDGGDGDDGSDDGHEISFPDDS